MAPGTGASHRGRVTYVTGLVPDDHVYLISLYKGEVRANMKQFIIYIMQCPGIA